MFKIPFVPAVPVLPSHPLAHRQVAQLSCKVSGTFKQLSSQYQTGTNPLFQVYQGQAIHLLLVLPIIHAHGSQIDVILQKHRRAVLFFQDMGNIHALPAWDVWDAGHDPVLHHTRHAKTYGRNLMARAEPAQDIQGTVRVLHHLVIGIRPYGKFLPVYDIPYAV